MIPRRQGRIINVVGGGAARPRPMVSGYGCAKAAIVRLTDSLAVETRAYNIPVFAIYPGLVRTEITEQILRSEAGQRWWPEARMWVEEGRFVPPERAAQLVVFLAAGHGDGLSGRCLYEHYDVAALAQCAEAIQRNDLYVLRLREEGLEWHVYDKRTSSCASPPQGNKSIRTCYAGLLRGAEPGTGADGFQRPFVPRFRFQPPLRPGVAMPSNVKGELPIFWYFLSPVSFRPSEEAEPGRHDGCACGAPWVDSHLACIRRVPASI
jgi:hypothetical protein